MAFSTWVAHTVAHEASSAFSPFVRSAEYAANALTTNVIPAPEVLMDLARRGWVKPETVEKWLLFHGVPLNVSGNNPLIPSVKGVDGLLGLWQQTYYAGQELPSVEQTFRLANRGFFSEDGLDGALQRLGFFSANVRATIANLRYDVPGPSDLVRFAVRHIFEPDLIQELGYPDERDKGPFLLDIYHAAAGINYPIFTGPLRQVVEEVTGKRPEEFAQFYADSGLKEPTWADAYWWAHWVLPSPTQGYQMYFRLRPDRDTKFDPPEAKGIEFPYRNLDLLLRANDYPPKFRPMLAAIARPIPGIRFIRQLRQYDVYTYDDVRELFLRMGYADRDATDLAQAVERNNQKQAGKGFETKAINQVLLYLELGLVDEPTATGMLKDFGLSDEEADKAVRLAALVEESARAKDFIRATRSAFGRGVLSMDEARQRLTVYGLQPTWVEQHLQEWAVTLLERRKTLSASEAVKAACNGLITGDDLAKRLNNLGFSAEDVTVLMGQAALCVATLQARAAAAAVRAEEKAQRALKQAQRDAAQAIRQARQQLSSHGTPAQLRKWFCEGHIGQLEVYDRLHQLGWPDPDIARLIGDCKQSAGGGGGARGGPRGPAGGGPTGP